jgi:tRNA pseudouridine55 synthase
VSGINGFIVVDKPTGVTSFAMVALVRGLTKVRRVGHAGTLDPLASGVLPVAVGQATRFIEYMDDALKTYVARVRFGEATDTYDAEGEVTDRGNAAWVDAAAVRAVLSEFMGDISQMPPMYSALKVAGKPLYRYAREGRDVAVAARTVHIESNDLRAFEDGVAELEVTCGKGTYIRSLAHDLGQRLGCPAHLAALRRAGSGGFTLGDAHAPAELEALAAEGRLDEVLLAIDRAVERRPAAIFEAAHSADVRAGRDVSLAPAATAGICRAYSSEGSFLGVLRASGGGTWHPERVVGPA